VGGACATLQLAVHHVEYLAAGALSLLVGAVINYLVSDHVVFMA